MLGKNGLDQLSLTLHFSEVFTKMFHGSLPEDTEVEVKGCSADSFQAMIDSIYQTGNLR